MSQIVIRHAIGDRDADGDGQLTLEEYLEPSGESIVQMCLDGACFHWDSESTHKRRHSRNAV